MKALSLQSGGLDGRLAARLLAEQGVEIEAVHFVTAFLRAERTGAARTLADLPVAVVDVAREHFERVVVQPKHGYGAAMNPCLDCRIFMLRKAADLARERGAELVATGEVLGQSRMSQRRESLERIEKESGLAGRLLRPLSAAHLAPTDAESRGSVDRARLGALHGRSRAPQLELARRLGVTDWPAPGGGCCLLADLGFSRRLRDLLSHAGTSYPGAESLARLRLGRHLRVSHDSKVVVARNDGESRELAGLSAGLWTCRCVGGGALVVHDGPAEDGALGHTAALAARYGAGRDLARAEVVCRLGGEERRLEVAPDREPDRYLV